MSNIREFSFSNSYQFSVKIDQLLLMLMKFWQCIFSFFLLKIIHSPAQRICSKLQDIPAIEWIIFIYFIWKISELWFCIGKIHAMSRFHLQYNIPGMKGIFYSTSEMYWWNCVIFSQKIKNFLCILVWPQKMIANSLRN